MKYQTFRWVRAQGVEPVRRAFQSRYPYSRMMITLGNSRESRRTIKTWGDKGAIECSGRHW
jgi:hypothetical protein